MIRKAAPASPSPNWLADSVNTPPPLEDKRGEHICGRPSFYAIDRRFTSPR
jgi:hypothetical protein